MRLPVWFLKRWSLLLVLLLGLTPLVWYQRGLIIAGGDNYFLLNPLALLPEILHTWSERFNFGLPNIQTYSLFPFYSFWVLLAKLGLSRLTTEILWSVAVFELTGLSIYFLFRSLRSVKGSLDNATQWGALTAAALYMFNVWVMIDAITPVMRLTAAFLPLFVLLWVKGLETAKLSLRYPLLIGFLSLFIVSAYAHPAAAVAIPLAFLLYLIVYLVRTRRFFPAFRFFLLTAVFYLIFNLWWLLPYLTSSLDIYRSVTLLAQTYQFLKTTPIFEAFRFMGFWAFQNYDEVKKIPQIPYAPLYYDPPFLFLGYFLSLLALAALFFRPKDRQVIFFTLLGLTGVFLAKGANSPFGSLYHFLYEYFPGFSVFREPFARFTGVTVFSFSFLLGVTVSHLYAFFGERFGRRPGAAGRVLWRAWPALILGTVFLLAFPLLTGRVIQDYSWHRQTFDDLHVSVPAYWSELDGWLKKNDPEAKILLLPRQPYGSCYRWDSGVCSSGRIATVLLANPLIFYPEDGYYLGDPIIQNLYDLIYRGDSGDLSPVFSFLGVGYVLAQNDYLWEGGDPRRRPEFTKRFLSQQKSLALKRTFGALDLYEYQNRDDQERIAAPASYEILGEDEKILPEKLLLLEGRTTSKFYLFAGQKYPPGKNLGEEAETVFLDLRGEEESIGRKKFSFFVPVAGSYEFYGKKSGYVPDFPQEVTYRLDGQPLTLEERPTAVPFWQGAGEVNLKPGQHSLEMAYRPSPPVSSPEGFFNGRFFDEGEGFWSLPADEKAAVGFIPFSAVAPNGLYKIAFWYRNVGGAPLSVGVHQNTCLLPVTRREFDGQSLFKEGCQNFIFPLSLENSLSWRSFEAVFAAGSTTQTAFLFFKFDKPGRAIQIKRLGIERVFDIALTAKNKNFREGKARNSPALTYRQESPTKYRVFIKNGVWPETLVLRQGFNKNWKLYGSPGGNRFLGGPLETFFLTPLPESRHFLVNGFANGWELYGDDWKNGERAWELVVEYQPERLYFLGRLLLAAGILFSLFYWLGVLRQRRW